MMRILSLAKLWDHCIELETLIQSHTAMDIYELQGKMPETLLSGKTADISPFIEHEWYNFVKWFDHGSSFPEPKEVHGRWLGPSMDIGTAMCSKIIKSNVQIINLSSYRGITEEERQDLTQKKLRDEFDCIEFEALIRPHTALDIYELQGKVPETLLFGQTADISPFIEHK